MCKTFIKGKLKYYKLTRDDDLKVRFIYIYINPIYKEKDFNLV